MPKIPSQVRAALASLSFLTLTFASGAAHAHAVGVSSGEYVAHGDKVDMKLAFARGEITRLVPTLDANHDGVLTPSEVEAAKAQINENVLAKMTVLGDMIPCPVALTNAALTEEDGLVVSGAATCTPTPREVTLRFGLADALSSGHRHVARLVGATRTDRPLHRGDRDVSWTPSEATSSAASAEGPSAAPKTLDGFVSMGVHHILEGWDHILFLLGLVIVFTTRRSLLAMVTAFTIGHSISLALATLDVVNPSSRIVEPLIALSIGYVGIENFVRKTPSKRWLIAFPFGLIHGFGFAGAMKEIGITRADAAVPLFGFNLGVEMGQLMVLAVAVPLISWLRKQEWFTKKGAPASNLLIAAVGLSLCVVRVVWPD